METQRNIQYRCISTEQMSRVFVVSSCFAANAVRSDRLGPILLLPPSATTTLCATEINILLFLTTFNARFGSSKNIDTTCLFVDEIAQVTGMVPTKAVDEAQPPSRNFFSRTNVRLSWEEKGCLRYPPIVQ